MPPALVRLFRVFLDSVSPAISASGKMSKIVAALIYVGVGAWMLAPGALLAALGRPGRVAGGMSFLAVLFLLRAYKLQAQVDELDVSIVLIRDKAGLIALLQEGKRLGQAALHVTARENVHNGAAPAKLWRGDMQRVIVDFAGSREFLTYANAKATGSSYLREDMPPEQRDEVLRLQGQLDAVESLIARVHREATEDAARFPQHSKRNS